MIKVTAEAIAAIKSFLIKKDNLQTICIDIHSTGCCDSSLGLSLCEIREDDLIQEIEGLTFVISREVYELVGEVTISYIDEKGKKGYVIRSSKPLNEWDGFGTCEIKL
jgi:Fe-S cluster assembly iron-binding protein IscA